MPPIDASQVIHTGQGRGGDVLGKFQSAQRREMWSRVGGGGEGTSAVATRQAGAQLRPRPGVPSGSGE